MGKERAVVDHVSDGDTIKVVTGGREEYVRLIGIDTPEVFNGVECGGPEASASMNKMLEPGDRVKLVRDRSQDNRDTYGRLLRYVEFNGRDLGQKQLSKGWAGVYVFDFDQPFERLTPYDRAEDRARAANRGAWGKCGGELHAALEASLARSPLVGAVHGFSTEPAGGQVGRIEPSTAAQLGIEGVTVLAIRPDRYVGFRQDGSDPSGLQAYLDALTA